MNKTKKAALVLAALICCAALLTGCSKKEEDPAHPKTYPYDAGEYTTNIRDSKKMLNCAIKVDVTSESLSKELAEKDYVAKDVVVKRLRQLTEDDLADPGLEDTLAESLVAALNEAMDTKNFYRVYFTRFVHQ